MTDEPTPPLDRPARSVTRRGLVAGVAGVAAGVAGTLGVEALGGGDAKRPPSAGEELMTEHGVLKRILLAYRAASDQLASGRTPPAAAILDAAQIISDYVEDFHEGLEEAYVFPRLATQPRYAALVSTLLTQHDRGRHHTAAIKALAAENLSDAHDPFDVARPARPVRHHV